MKEKLKKYFDISILDWLGKVNDGVAILLCLRIFDESYDIVYWISPDGKWKIDFDENLKEKYGIENVYQMENLKDLIIYIDREVLPERSEIWKEFSI